ncbi:uncharacterized protein EI90DRAFT_2951192 [Cantharellus anzutake]|uniref:uncharacterized protein n=1 Tax=Cantharellus anzutake TaxID=1750568 RepID=UPI001905E923|nr:uncharacterized protein EI90DRAFT_2951192 [Cantharellus anzutake]KAF8312577.1 hypothetical protein EI90DRAFT_2951192 [Cantharellus anzutake]
MILLTLQGDRHGSKMTQPETQVIPVAIAMFQYNNKKRVNTGLAPLDAMTVPCIAMARTRPTFYLVPVTKALRDAVVSGEYPETPTTVLKCNTVLGPNRPISKGMEDRRLAFQRLIAFKDLSRGHWKKFVE